MIYLPSWIPFARKKQNNKVYAYEFVDVHQYEGCEDVHMGVKIIDGPYKDLVYYYRRVQFVEDKENDACHVKFEWFPLKNAPEHETQDLYDVIGNILTHIVENVPGQMENMQIEKQETSY